MSYIIATEFLKITQSSQQVKEKHSAKPKTLSCQKTLNTGVVPSLQKGSSKHLGTRCRQPALQGKGVSSEFQHLHASAPWDKQTPKLWESCPHDGLQMPTALEMEILGEAHGVMNIIPVNPQVLRKHCCLMRSSAKEAVKTTRAETVKMLASMQTTDANTPTKYDKKIHDLAYCYKSHAN